MGRLAPISAIFSADAERSSPRFLPGVQPTDLPVERPTRILLAINMKTAATLGVNFPQVVLPRADSVIE